MKPASKDVPQSSFVDGGRGERVARALVLLEEALELLDRASAPPEVGASLQATINQVQSLLDDGAI